MIVVGAGPAGSTAAAALGRLGRRVLLLDRQSFPRDKTCGDAIQAGAIEILRELGYTKPLDPACFHPVSAWTIEAPNRRIVAAALDTHGHDPYIARRVQFDQLVYDQALTSGVQFVQRQVTAPVIEAGRVIGVEARRPGSRTVETFRAPVVIAADGATSVMRRALLPNREPDVHHAVAIRGYAQFRTRLDPCCEFYFPKVIMPGYGWLFPTGDHSANIGIGMRRDQYRRRGLSLEALFDLFLDMLGDRLDRDSLSEVQSWQLPFGSSQQPRAVAGSLLIGDAGSFIDPLLGAGIYNAMRTGRLAAQVIDNALAMTDPLPGTLASFDRRWRQMMGGGLRRARWVQQIIVGQPWLMNAVFTPASLHPALGRRVVMALSGEKI